MLTRPLDIAICGCGPTGLSASLLLHRLGHRVRIFERFDTPRPVGSGLILQPTGLAVLSELGLLDRILRLGARIDRLFGRVVPSGRVVLDVRYRALVRGGMPWRCIGPRCLMRFMRRCANRVSKSSPLRPSEALTGGAAARCCSRRTESRSEPLTWSWMPSAPIRRWPWAQRAARP